MCQIRNDKTFDIQGSCFVAYGRKCVFRCVAGYQFEIFDFFWFLFEFTGQTGTSSTVISDESEKEAGISTTEATPVFV